MILSLTVDEHAAPWADTVVAVAARRLDPIFAREDVAEIRWTTDPPPWHLTLRWEDGPVRGTVSDALGLRHDGGRWRWPVDGRELPVFVHRALSDGLLLSAIDMLTGGRTAVTWDRLCDTIAREDVPATLQQAWSDEDARDPWWRTVHRDLGKLSADYVRAHRDDVHRRLGSSG